MLDLPGLSVGPWGSDPSHDSVENRRTTILKPGPGPGPTRLQSRDLWWHDTSSTTRHLQGEGVAVCVRNGVTDSFSQSLGARVRKEEI